MAPRLHVLFVLPLLPGCTLPYLTQAGAGQLELLASRRPIEEVLARGGLSAGEEQRLRLVGQIKAFGRSIGLSATHNYETYADGWPRHIWNLSASDPLAFHNKTWSFPIVGTVPYLGFFRTEHVQPWQDKLTAQGLDVWVREAGAYSTLGFFRDPILPGMLRWDEGDLADTILHELAHATLWIPGSVSFNETFANVVGEAAARQYLVATYGDPSPTVTAWDDDQHDVVVWRAVLMQLYADLDAVYQDPTLDDAAKTTRKAALFAALPDRAAQAELRHPARFVRAAKTGTWNNARMLQYRTYNHNEANFQALLAKHDGDISAFISDLDRLTHGQRDPVSILEHAVQNP